MLPLWLRWGAQAWEAHTTTSSPATHIHVHVHTHMFMPAHLSRQIFPRTNTGPSNALVARARFTPSNPQKNTPLRYMAPHTCLQEVTIWAWETVSTARVFQNDRWASRCPRRMGRGDRACGIRGSHPAPFLFQVLPRLPLPYLPGFSQMVALK